MTVKMAIFTGDIYHILENLRKDYPITNVILKRLKFWEIRSSTFYVTTSTSADPGGLYWTGAHLTQQSLGHCCGPPVHSIQESSIFDEIFSKPFSALHAKWSGVQCKTDDDDAALSKYF